MADNLQKTHGFTETQMRARVRNWQIFRLRGMQRSLHDVISDDARRNAVKEIIDKELQSLGALTEEQYTNELHRKAGFWHEY